jgi:hypothetical protein
VHTTGFVPTQAPLWQVSVCVQAFPSLHVVASTAAIVAVSWIDVLVVPAP